MLICRDNCERLINDMKLLEWDTNAMEKAKYTYRKGFADHLCDGLQYMSNLSSHHDHDFQEDKRMPYGSPDWYAQKEFAMEQGAIERMQEARSDEMNAWDELDSSTGDW
jgi:hypothetical protein